MVNKAIHNLVESEILTYNTLFSKIEDMLLLTVGAPDFTCLILSNQSVNKLLMMD